VFWARSQSPPHPSQTFNSTQICFIFLSTQKCSIFLSTQKWFTFFSRTHFSPAEPSLVFTRSGWGLAQVAEGRRRGVCALCRNVPRQGPVVMVGRKAGDGRHRPQLRTQSGDLSRAGSFRKLRPGVQPGELCGYRTPPLPCVKQKISHRGLGNVTLLPVIG
jgi:hypothetical protein